MSRIADLTARALYDSNGAPAIEVEVRLEDGSFGRALAPRGSTTGRYEATVLEDPDAGASLEAVAPALDAFHQHVRPALLHTGASDQEVVDQSLDALDPSERRERIGGNVTVALSMAVAQAAARSAGLPLHLHLRREDGREKPALPSPVFNILDGSPEAACPVAGMEFLALPAPGTPVTRALEMGIALREEAGALLRAEYGCGGDSTQGAWRVHLDTPEDGLELVMRSLEASGLRPREDVSLGLDLAASDYAAEGFPWATPEERREPALLCERFLEWSERYAVTYVEDPFGEGATAAWIELVTRMRSRDVLVVGDDLFASRRERIERGAEHQWATAALIKPNQIGTVTGALLALEAARDAGMTAGVSQRGGENGGSFITSLAVAGGASFLKAGGMSRMDRIAKYNQLLRIRARSETAAAPTFTG